MPHHTGSQREACFDPKVEGVREKSKPEPSWGFPWEEQGRAAKTAWGWLV